MANQIMYGAALFLLGWLWFFFFIRQFLFNFLTAFPLIRKMRALQEGLIAVGAVRYTFVSVFVSSILAAVVLAVILWLCPLYLKISFAIGAVLGFLMYCTKLTPTNRAMFDSFCTAYYGYVPDDELRTAIYNKKTGQMKARLRAMGISGSFIPEFKN